ncbi:MAG: ABC transporter permease subunit [Bacteroidales bacterium]|nr:ABC transporter permease subunit [Clostridium sp.]MCM1204192.1 ABC transporter permease subunit [Bacteroidales bacterium]
MNYRQLKTLYKKEIMDVIRDKKTILTMVVLPVILYPLLFVVIMQVITLINTTQQEQTYYIAYDGVEDTHRLALNDWIAGKDDGYDYVIKEVESEEPQKDLEEETIDAYLTVETTESQIIYEVHYLSAVNNSLMVSGMLEEEIDSLAKNIAEKNAKEEGLDVKRVLYPVMPKLEDASSSESSVGSILGSVIPFLMITSILMGAMYPAIDATAGEKERGTLETLLTLPVGNMELIMSKFLSVATIAVVSVFINVLSIGGIAAYFYATISALTENAGDFKLGSFVPAILISFICVIAFALFMSAVVMCICAFAKSFKEANNYVTPLTLVVLLTGYIGFIPNIELSTATALVPVANICLLMKNLLVFKYDFTLILMVLLSNVVYAFVAVWVLGRIYNSETILFGESASGIKLFERRKNIKKGSLPTIKESLLIMIVALLLMVYLGGLMSLEQPLMGVIIPQFFIGVLPVLACVYIKGDGRKIFALHCPKGKDIFGGLILLIGAGSLSLLISNLLTYLFSAQSENLNEEYLELLDGVPFAGALLLIALLPAVCEELMYRGYMFTAFKQKMSLRRAIFFVAVLFGISHMSLIKIIPTAILGAALAYAMHKADSIVVSGMMHFLNNAFSVFVLYYGEKVAVFQDEQMSGALIAGLCLLAAVGIPAGIRLLNGKKERIEEA